MRHILPIPKWVKRMPGYKHDLRWMGFTVHKEFFDVGYGTTSPIKNIVILAGAGTILASGGNAMPAIIAYSVYMVLSYIFGRLWCKYGVHVAEFETSNIFNPFVGDVRNSKILKDKK